MPSAFVDGVSTTSATISVPAHDNRVTVSSVGFSGRSKQFNVLGPVVGFEPRVTTPVVAGSPFTVTVFAVDAAHNRLGGYSGPATWSDRSGALTPATPSPFLDGVATTSATIPTPFHDDRITVISGGLSGRSTQFGVHGPLAGFHFRIATPVSAGSPFTVTVFARDAAGNRLKSYSGPAIWSDRSGALSPATPSAFVDGVSTTSATIAVPAHDERITLTSGGRTGSSGQFNVR
jgi:hypothetical protein